jgi:hypothetical protein
MSLASKPNVRRKLTRRATSWVRVLAQGHGGARTRTAYRAPHAPSSKSQSQVAVAEHSADGCRTTSATDALKQLELKSCDGQVSAFKAARKVSNQPDKSAALHVRKNQVRGRIWSDRVAELSYIARIQGILGIVGSPKWTTHWYEESAQPSFESAAPAPQSRFISAPRSRPTRRAILTHRLIESNKPPSLASVRPRSSGASLRRITPA